MYNNFICSLVSLVNIVVIFIEDGKVCTHYNVPTYGTDYSSGDILQLPRNGREATVVILGIHGMFVSIRSFFFARLAWTVTFVLHNDSQVDFL